MPLSALLFLSSAQRHSDECGMRIDNDNAMLCPFSIVFPLLALITLDEYQTSGVSIFSIFNSTSGEITSAFANALVTRPSRLLLQVSPTTPRRSIHCLNLIGYRLSIAYHCISPHITPVYCLANVSCRRFKAQHCAVCCDTSQWGHAFICDCDCD